MSAGLKFIIPEVQSKTSSNETQNNVQRVSKEEYLSYGKSDLVEKQSTCKQNLVFVVRFANNSFALENKESLQMISDAVSKNKGSIKKIIIVGHTSKVGSKDYNRKLSFKRALAIREFLISKGAVGINIDLSGKDFSELVSGKKHNENRRTEVLIQLKGEDACL
jgi:outer membrane protein OmpA-like peptidoglycan-associated protein